MSQASTGEVVLRLNLPDSPSAALFPKFTADYWVTVGKTLTAQLVIANVSDGQEFTFEDCLHTYFHIGEYRRRVRHRFEGRGLPGQDGKLRPQNRTRRTHQRFREEAEPYLSEYDRAGGNPRFESWASRIRIEKSGSLSTVVWNPWVDKAEQMPDFGGDEFQKMICVESGNVADNRVTLPAGKSNTLKIEIGTLPL